MHRPGCPVTDWAVSHVANKQKMQRTDGNACVWLSRRIGASRSSALASECFAIRCWSTVCSSWLKTAWCFRRLRLQLTQDGGARRVVPRALGKWRGSTLPGYLTHDDITFRTNFR